MWILPDRLPSEQYCRLTLNLMIAAMQHWHGEPWVTTAQQHCSTAALSVNAVLYNWMDWADDVYDSHISDSNVTKQ